MQLPCDFSDFAANHRNSSRPSARTLGRDRRAGCGARATAASWRRVPLRGLDAATESLLLLLPNADSTASPNQSVPGTPKRVDPPGHRSALGSRSVADARKPRHKAGAQLLLSCI